MVGRGAGGVRAALGVHAPSVPLWDARHPSAAPAPVDVQLLSITDFHGYLQPYNDAANGQVQLPDGTRLSVGGAAYNAAHLQRLSAGRRNSILFSAGDNFSGWPFEVDAFGDEPTVEVLNKLGVRFSTVGNHERPGHAGRQHVLPARTALAALAADLPYAKGTSAGDADGRITFGEAWRSYGYGNRILTVGLTGEKIREALEQQRRKGGFAPLAVSRNVRYRYDAARPEGQRVDAKDVLIDGRPLDPARTYRVAALAYTLIGADGFPALTGFTDPYRNAPADHEAFVAYLRAHPVLTPAPLDRVSA